MLSVLKGDRSLEPQISSNIEKVVSGGQTGVDRAALDTALEFHIACGGWCPRGRKAEDGRIDSRYPLKETDSGSYRARTERNVKESDGTLILTCGQPKEGTALTIKLARRYKKPYCVVDLSVGRDAEAVERWAKTSNIKVLNVAGPRESQFPGIYGQAVEFLRKVFSRIKNGQVFSHD